MDKIKRKKNFAITSIVLSSIALAIAVLPWSAVISNRFVTCNGSDCAAVGMIFGIMAIPLFYFILPALVILGIVFGACGIGKKVGSKINWLSTIGIAIGVVAAVAGISFVVYLMNIMLKVGS